MSQLKPHLSPILIRKAIDEALLEDLGRAGDITTNATIPADTNATCVLASREDGIVSRMALARAAFAAIDPDLKFKALVDDCDTINAGEKLATIKGNARSILSAERVALNYLMRMSGIASYRTCARFCRAFGEG